MSYGIKSVTSIELRLCMMSNNLSESVALLISMRTCSCH